MAYQSVNPYNGKVLNTFKELTDQRNEFSAWEAVSRGADFPNE